MITDADVQKIIEAQREVFPTKVEFEEFRGEMRQNSPDILTAVDAYAKKADTYFQEMVALSSKVNRLEQAVKKIAQQVGVDIDL